MNRAAVGCFIVLIMFLVAGCSSSGQDPDNTVSGVVTEVNGDLSSVTGFVVLTDDGASHKFEPQTGLLFSGGPLSHLREHVVTGQRVVVSFTQGDGGELIAVQVEDS